MSKKRKSSSEPSQRRPIRGSRSGKARPPVSGRSAPGALRLPIEPTIEGDAFRCGYVALVGRPNVGKSTILNQLVGMKVAATTHKPQTTRKNLLGMLNPPGAQILILDTPGHHQAKGRLNRFMVDQAEQAIAEADVIAYVIEAREDDAITPGNDRLIEVIKRQEIPIVLLINKIDALKQKKNMLHQIERYRGELGERLLAVVPICARTKQGLEEAVREIGQALPEGPALYESDGVVDAPERALVAEFIREKVILETKEELPYSAAVTVEWFEDDRPRLVRIAATIHVERDSQKGIVIGKGGERLKSIGTRARKEVERLLESPVFLDLNVRVTDRWSESSRALAELGYE